MLNTFVLLNIFAESGIIFLDSLMNRVKLLLYHTENVFNVSLYNTFFISELNNSLLTAQLYFVETFRK